MVRKYHDALLGRYTRELHNLMQRISSGVCADYATYREMAGKCTQLRTVIDSMHEELTKFIEDDES